MNPENQGSINLEYIWVDNTEQLNALCEQWSQQAAIAVDTEFMRSTTFFPKTGLLQISDGLNNYLVDPLPLDDLTALQALWRNPSVTKVFHACSEDLEVFQRWLGCLPEPMFDTQIGAAFAGMGFSLSYAKLVNANLDVELQKGETRSDWLRRPLSQAQKHYAALDVAYLVVVYANIIEKLKAQNKLQWALDDCQLMLDGYKDRADLSQSYLKIRGAWRLAPSQLATLQSLCLWREVTARERDIPRNRLLKDAQLLDITRLNINSLDGLSKIDDIPARTLREDGNHLLSLLTSDIGNSETWPAALPKPLTVEQGQRLKAIRDFAFGIGNKLDLQAELLLNKKEYELIVRLIDDGDIINVPRMLGWRHDLIVTPLVHYGSTLA